MVKAVCKFRVHSVTQLGVNYERVKMTCQYDRPLSKEDEAFSGATPSGDLEFTLANPTLCGKFKPGQVFLVRLEEVLTEKAVLDMLAKNALDIAKAGR